MDIYDILGINYCGFCKRNKMKVCEYESCYYDNCDTKEVKDKYNRKVLVKEDLEKDYICPFVKLRIPRKLKKELIKGA